MGECERVQSIFLVCVCSVYLIAFVSLFVQIPGLYGNNGILPARLALKKDIPLKEVFKTQPTLLHLLIQFGIRDVELGFNLICFSGALISFLAFIKSCFRNSWTFLILWIFYQSLFQVGQTFLWFQWDTLLLELGFLVIFVAPMKLPFKATTEPTKYGRSVSFWLVKWLTFRLMFCSGVVKLNSQCPTWWGLTAMTYHYESQCIPTPLAWYAHRLPHWFQKASTAFVFIIQIVTSILFFSPFRAHRIFSFFVQSLLMVLIIITGNYNFFNWVSIVMCLSLLDDQFINSVFKGRSHDIQEDFLNFLKEWKLSQFVMFLGKIIRAIVHLLVISIITYVAHQYFSINILFSPFRITSNIEFSFEEFQIFLNSFVPLTICVAIASLVVTITCSFIRAVLFEKGFAKKLFAASVVVLAVLIVVPIFCVTLVPYTDIHRGTQLNLPKSFIKWHRDTREFNIFNAYGLFRSMTGVGGRPEVIVEGSNSPDRGWKELNFLYKPGDVNRCPPFVAPHQPRLDWQMWFAALGSYNYNPWFYHLVYRILTHEESVLSLLDKGPFNESPPKYIRASLYLYHYTGWNESTKSWWRREYQHEYLPVLSLEDQFLSQYVRETDIYVDPSQDQLDLSRKSICKHFFKFLHVIAPPRYGCEICGLILLLGILAHYFAGKNPEKERLLFVAGGKQKIVPRASQLLKQS